MVLKKKKRRTFAMQRRYFTALDFLALA